MVFSRIRYPCHCMEVPKHILDSIKSDTQALLWQKDYAPDPTLWGSDLEKKRWMKQQSQSGKPRTHLGVGLLDIESHIKALKVKQLLTYNDASQGAWKQVLDCWFQRSVYGRGAVFTTIHITELTESITHRASALPRFWVEAIHAVRELTLIPLGEPSRIGALGQPVFDNPCFTIPYNIFRDFWREKARVATVRDLLTEEGDPQPVRQIITECVKLLKVKENKFLYNLKNHIYHIPPLRMWQEWEAIAFAVPRHIRLAARGITPAREDKGETILRGMGWDGGPLRPGGETLDTLEPLFSPHKGFGVKKSKEKKKEMEVKIIAYPDGEFEYGTPKISKVGSSEEAMRHQLTEIKLSTKGVPRRTHNDIMIDPKFQAPTGKWGRGITGPAATAFPIPREWTFEGLDKPLDRVTTRDLTRVFTELERKDPTCIETWNTERALHSPGEMNSEGPFPVKVNTMVNFQKLAHRIYSTAVLPPPVINLHFKFITHRKLPLTWQLEEHQHLGCRLGCGCKKESYLHLAECIELNFFRVRIAHLTEEPRFRNCDTFLLGDVAIGEIEKGATSLWMVWWHTTILALIGRTADNEEIKWDPLWKGTIQKFANFAIATAHTADLERSRY